MNGVVVPQAFLSHAVPGRFRVKVPSMRGNAGYFADAAGRLGECELVESVVVNERTGSILALCAAHTTAAHIGEYGRARELFQLEEGRPPVPAVLDQVASGYSTLDRGIGSATEGALNARSAVLVMLLVLGFVQLYRGQIAAPAATLFWYVLELLRRP
jgi:hypothetical protein